jgi:hypothetical protein
MIFAREVSDPLISLIKKIDLATANHSKEHMGSFVVFLNDDAKLENQLKDLADKAHLEHTVLAIDKPAGPPTYDISSQADVTVVLYVKHNVKANYAFRKGELKGSDSDWILADLPKIFEKTDSPK